MTKYICSKADDVRCPGCEHEFPHLKSKERPCTSWADCFNRNGEKVFKVRCVSIESDEGIKILENISGQSSSQWLRDGSLLYKLGKDNNNSDEIHIRMANGSLHDKNILETRAEQIRIILNYERL